ncbi:MAG: hypothetical protein ACRDH2_13970 [Anaerolineales bacterium]
MFDKLRQQSVESAETDEEVGEPEAAPARPALRMPAVRMPTGRVSLGLTPSQRFVLALMLFLNITVLGCFALVAFEKVALPF